MKILVTGATGFLGRCVIAELVRRKGFEIVTTGARVSSENLPNYLAADITNRESVAKLERFEPLEVVIHAAGLAHQFGETGREKFWAVNVEGTRNIAELSVRLQASRFILISSVAVYGAQDADFDEPDKIHGGKYQEDISICRPRGFYAESKLAAERAAAEICGKNGIELIIARPATIVGEGDAGNVGRLIGAIDRGRFIWVGTGKNRKSLIYKTDAARACAALAEHKFTARHPSERIYNVTAEPKTMREIVGDIEKNLGRAAPRYSIPETPLLKILSFLGGARGSSEIKKRAETVEKWLSEDVYSGAKIAAEIGFRPETDIFEALRKQTEAYRAKK